MQAVPIKASNTLQGICRGIDNQLIFLKFKAGCGT